MEYWAVRNELCVIGRVILRGTLIVIPKGMRKQVLQIAHEGHPGIVKMKNRLRSKVWWPKIDKDAEQFCKKCHGCQLVGLPERPEPMSRTTLPQGPWQDLAIDFLGPFPSGDNILVVIDYYSRNFEIDIMKSISSEKTIQSLKRIFTTHGLPYSITSDNGPQFKSEIFQEFCIENNIQHRFVTPLWPQAMV